MKIIRNTSMKESREMKALPQTLEQELTDIEIENIERDIAITENELAIFELQLLMEEK